MSTLLHVALAVPALLVIRLAYVVVKNLAVGFTRGVKQGIAEASATEDD